MTNRDRLAINPLPWVLSETGFDLSTERLSTALTQLATAGYSSVHADVPSGMSASDYLGFIGGFGFSPAPGYFSGEFHDVESRAQTTEAARVHAAMMAELGLTEVFIASNLGEQRIARPVVGANASPERIAAIADGLVAAAAAMRSEGVTAALHPHIGSWVETEEEVRGVLDATAGSALQFGPDTGHLTWAGMDAASVMADYRDRIVAAHLKDVDTAAAAAALAAGASYFDATAVHHVWTEPGRGAIDFTAALNAMPSDFTGWFVVEVDVPNIGTPLESAAASREFLLAHPYFAEKD
jgi:inosose dehydratase